MKSIKILLIVILGLLGSSVQSSATVILKWKNIRCCNRGADTCCNDPSPPGFVLAPLTPLLKEQGADSEIILSTEILESYGFIVSLPKDQQKPVAEPEAVPVE